MAVISDCHAIPLLGELPRVLYALVYLLGRSPSIQALVAYPEVYIYFFPRQFASLPLTVTGAY